jgi:hypothetical protein
MWRASSRAGHPAAAAGAVGPGSCNVLRDGAGLVMKGPCGHAGKLRPRGQIAACP